MLQLRRLAKALPCALVVVLAIAWHLGTPRAQEGESAQDIFHDHISGPLVQTRCINCHVAGGLSGHTRLVLVRSTETDHEAINLRAFEDLLHAVEGDGGVTYVLNKIQGVSHGGGRQVAAGSDSFANMQRFLSLLGTPVATATLTPDTLFDTVRLAPDWKTLRRAALIFAGRIPTDTEYAAIESGNESDLRAAIRGLMTGPEFHEFLIRGGNDRLLTDRRDTVLGSGGHFVDYTNEYFLRKKAAHTDGRERAWREFYSWVDRVQHGVRREPLELIAYVVENDRPYTEVLTADYVMANPWSAKAYGASTIFRNPQDVFEFRPSTIAKYYRQGEEFEEDCDPQIIGACYVVDPGPLRTFYPHAGILNTLSFLLRYPTTATNRNRARARWTYYHFLGLDVEKSASRTTDPVALADTNNPTLLNPNCTVCHSILDPVAGAFQNYGEEGLYRDQWEGLDSLDRLYKEDDGPTLTVQAQSWRQRERLAWSVTLGPGIQTLRVMYPNHFWDEVTREGGRLFLDRLDVVDAAGDVLVNHEFEDLEAPVPHWDGSCGEKRASRDGGRNDHFTLWAGGHTCAYYIALEIVEGGVYDVEIVAWSNGWDARYEGDGFAELSVMANAYEEGDTWYGDMRAPGFDGDRAPDPGNSVQWLAQRIVDDERFAEATVKFWWPAVMGSEVAEFPEEASDADFEGRLLAANAQDAEVARLAAGFRDGFPGRPHTYNLKDLLVEIVLSNWFRADSLADTHAVRRAALRDAGARRLLTPEELAAKTAAITGIQWGRHVRLSCYPECDRTSNALGAEFRLFYGGIDSAGITERARDITSIMAAVAKRHAVQVSCPVVVRDFFLVPDGERRLFNGIDLSFSPATEFRGVFQIRGKSRAARETFSLSGMTPAGPGKVRLTFIQTRRGQKIRLDRLDVRDAAGGIVASYQIKDAEWYGHDCGRSHDDNFSLYCSGRSVNVPFEVPAAGTYTFEVTAWAGEDSEGLPSVEVLVESDTEGSVGAAVIRAKLAELHDKLLGARVSAESPDVEAAYQLFVDVSTRGRTAGEYRFRPYRCDFDHDHFFFDGIMEDAVIERESDSGRRHYKYDWDRVHDFIATLDFLDPHSTARAWAVVLAALMMDYRYLYL